MQPFDAVTMALFDGHYAGLVLTCKDREKNEILYKKYSKSITIR